MKLWKVFPQSQARFNDSCLDPIRTGLGNWENTKSAGWEDAVESKGNSFIAFQRAKGIHS